MGHPAVFGFRVAECHEDFEIGYNYFSVEHIHALIFTSNSGEINRTVVTFGELT